MIIQDFILEEGLYMAEIDSIHEGPMVTTKRGQCSTIEVEFELLDLVGALRFKRQRYLAFASNKMLRQLFRAALGHCPVIMDARELMGKDCIVKIGHNRSTTTGKLFANVIDVISAEEK